MTCARCRTVYICNLSTNILSNSFLFLRTCFFLESNIHNNKRNVESHFWCAKTSSMSESTFILVWLKVSRITSFEIWPEHLWITFDSLSSWTRYHKEDAGFPSDPLRIWQVKEIRCEDSLPLTAMIKTQNNSWHHHKWRYTRHGLFNAKKNAVSFKNCIRDSYKSRPYQKTILHA